MTSLLVRPLAFSQHVRGDKLINDLRKEIQLLQTLDHPNIIKMYEVRAAWNLGGGAFSHAS